LKPNSSHSRIPLCSLQSRAEEEESVCNRKDHSHLPPYFIAEDIISPRRGSGRSNIPEYPSHHWILTILLVLSLGINLPLQAEWGRTARDYIELPLYRDAHICSDGNGGCWATGVGVGLCHVDRNGNLTWGDEPFGIQPGSGFNQEPVSADNGDVIVAMDIYNEDDDLTDVYLQRVNLDQEFLWGEDGIQLDTSSRLEHVVSVYKGPVHDTYLIFWGRQSELNQCFGKRLQLVNGDGDFLWSVGGIGLNRYPSRGAARITLSSDRCVIVAYSTEVDEQGDMNVLKINSDGELLWSEKYAILTGAVRGKTLRDIESDRTGGAILIYEYSRLEYLEDGHLYHFGIKAMRISGNGDSLWTRQVYEREEEFRGETPRQIAPIMNYAGEGYFLVAWADFPHTFQVVSLDIDGEYLWDEPEDVILNPNSYGKLDAVGSDDAVCYTWRDINNNREDGGSVQQWGQRISINGERLWGDRGRAIQARSDDQSSITTDCNGGVITVVEYNPTVQMINHNGEIGVVLPVSVDDDFDKSKSSLPSPQLFIYPNPGNSQFRIEYDTGLPDELFNYSIYDLIGRTMKTGTIKGGHDIVNDLSRFSSGEYILRLQSPRTTVSTRFLLIK